MITFLSRYLYPQCLLLLHLFVSPFQPKCTGPCSTVGSESHTFVEHDHENISTVNLLQLIQEGLRKYVYKVLVNCLVELAKEKEWLDELTVFTLLLAGT